LSCLQAGRNLLDFVSYHSSGEFSAQFFGVCKILSLSVESRVESRVVCNCFF